MVRPRTRALEIDLQVEPEGRGQAMGRARRPRPAGRASTATSRCRSPAGSSGRSRCSSRSVVTRKSPAGVPRDAHSCSFLAGERGLMSHVEADHGGACATLEQIVCCLWVLGRCSLRQAGLTLPGNVRAPSINVTFTPESFRSGALRNTVAMVVIAPVGTMVRSGPYSRAAAMMKSTAEPGASRSARGSRG